MSCRLRSHVDEPTEVLGVREHFRGCGRVFFFDRAREPANHKREQQLVSSFNNVQVYGLRDPERQHEQRTSLQQFEGTVHGGCSGFRGVQF